MSGHNDRMPEKRSRFITIVAWALILISTWNGIGAVLGFFTDPDTSILVQDFSETPLVSFAMFHSKTINTALLILSIPTLIGAIGLLWSKHWARVVLVVVLPIGVLYNIFDIMISSEILGDIMSAENANGTISNPEDVHDTIELAVKIGFWLFIAFNVGMSVLYIWIVKRLLHGG